MIAVQLFIGLLTLVVNAFFVGAEFALISVRRSQIEPEAEAGNRRARSVIWGLEHVSALLAAAQLGITLCTLVLGIVTFGVVYSAANGVWPSFYGEMFSTRVRLSGMAIGTQIGFAVAGFAVTFAAQIAGPDGSDWSAVAIFTAALCVPPVIAVLTARETHSVPTEQLGERTPKPTAERATVTA